MLGMLSEAPAPSQVKPSVFRRRNSNMSAYAAVLVLLAWWLMWMAPCFSGSTVIEPLHGLSALSVHDGVSSLPSTSHSITSEKDMRDGENISQLVI